MVFIVFMHLYMPSLAMNLYTLSKTMGAMTISPPFLVKRVLCICSIAGMPLPLVWEPQNLCEMPLLEVTREVARLWSMPCYRLSMEYFGVSSVFIFILELWPPSSGTSDIFGPISIGCMLHTSLHFQIRLKKNGCIRSHTLFRGTISDLCIRHCN